MEMQTPQGWSERLRNKEYAIREHHRDTLAEVIDELLETRKRRGKLLEDIFNSEAGEMLPVEIKQQIDAEIMGHNVEVSGAQRP